MKGIKGIKKHFTIYCDVETHRLVEQEAARLKVPMVELFDKWLEPHFRKLKEKNEERSDDE